MAHAWRLWEYPWQTPSRPGRQVLLARATDQRGRSQPMERNPDRRNYQISHVLPMEGPGLGTELQAGVFDRSDLKVRRSEP